MHNNFYAKHKSRYPFTPLNARSPKSSQCVAGVPPVVAPGAGNPPKRLAQLFAKSKMVLVRKSSVSDKNRDLDNEYRDLDNEYRDLDNESRDLDNEYRDLDNEYRDIDNESRDADN